MKKINRYSYLINTELCLIKRLEGDEDCLNCS